MSLIRFSTIALAMILFLTLPVTALSGTLVRMQTSLGVIDIDMFDEGAPQTVENFLRYVNDGDYDNSFFHRSMSNFIIQGGGFLWGDNNRYRDVPKDDPVINEFSLDRSNLRGTIAMAKLGGNPNSATNQWFFNLKDNSENLDNQNGGFTVFGQVKESGLAVIDAIGLLKTYDADGANASTFDDLPLVSLPDPGPNLTAENLVMVDSVTVLPTISARDEDRIFNYLEAKYQQYVSPASQPSTNGYGYYYRYYPGQNAYVGIANGRLYYLGPLYGSEVTDLGSVGFWLNVAVTAGY